MSRPSRFAKPTNSREKLKQDFTRSVPLRQIYPQLAEVRVELEFDDGTLQSPSSQSFSYFPAARGFFRYSCPCHSCNGEFDLSKHVAELAGKTASKGRSRNIDVSCSGERARDSETREACPVVAQVRVSAVLRPVEKAS